MKTDRNRGATPTGHKLLVDILSPPFRRRSPQRTAALNIAICLSFSNWLLRRLQPWSQRLPVRPEIYLPLSFNGGGPPVVER